MIRATSLEIKTTMLDYLDQLSRTDPIKVLLVVSSPEKSGREEYCQFYDQVIPRAVFTCTALLEDVVAASFAIGPWPNGYESGLVIAVCRYGKGRIILNTMRVLENLNQHPAADRLLLNLIDFAAAAK